MSEVEVVCPSGLAGSVRGLKGREIDLFVNKAEARKRKIGNKILSTCWLKTTSPGPYSFETTPDFARVLQADRFYVMLQIRMATYGSTYAFPVKCDDEDCLKPYEWELDLKDLPVKKVTEADLETFKAGNRFETEFGGRRVVYRLPTGETASKIEQHMERSPEGRLTAAIKQRLIEVEGVESHAWQEWLQDLDAMDLEDMVELFDEHDGGVETDIDIECPYCGAPKRVRLPFDRVSIWQRPKRKKDAASSTI